MANIISMTIKVIALIQKLKEEEKHMTIFKQQKTKLKMFKIKIPMIT